MYHHLNFVAGLVLQRGAEPQHMHVAHGLIVMEESFEKSACLAQPIQTMRSTALLLQADYIYPLPLPGVLRPEREGIA